MVLLTFGHFFAVYARAPDALCLPVLALGGMGIRYGCIDRCDPGGPDVLISAIAIVANLVTATIAIIASTIPIICAIDVILIVAATIAIVAVAMAIVGDNNFGF